MWTLFINFLEELALGMLGTFFKTLTTTLQSSGIGGNEIQAITDIIDSVQNNPSYAGQPTAAAVAIKNGVSNYLSTNKIQIGDDAVNALIALATHNQNVTAANGAAPSSSAAAAAS